MNSEKQQQLAESSRGLIYIMNSKRNQGGMRGEREERFHTVTRTLLIISISSRLDARWEQVNADCSADGLWWEVLGELSSHSSRVAVGLCDATPDDADGRVLNGALTTVDESDSLS
jgi:hypothetical protein